MNGVKGKSRRKVQSCRSFSLNHDASGSTLPSSHQVELGLFTGPTLAHAAGSFLSPVKHRTGKLRHKFRYSMYYPIQAGLK